MPFSIPRDVYLAILASMTAEDNPLTAAGVEGHEKSGPALATLAQAMATFVVVFTETNPQGYQGARDMLENLVHTFPVEDAPKPAPKKASLEDSLAKLLAELEAAPTAEDPLDGFKLGDDKTK
jgi:hypothetical protein